MCTGINIDASEQKPRDDGMVGLFGRAVNPRYPTGGRRCGICVCSPLQERVDGPRLAALLRRQQSGAAQVTSGCGVDVGTGLQKQVPHQPVAVVRCSMEGHSAGCLGRRSVGGGVGAEKKVDEGFVAHGSSGLPG